MSGKKKYQKTQKVINNNPHKNRYSNPSNVKSSNVKSSNSNMPSSIQGLQNTMASLFDSLLKMENTLDDEEDDSDIFRNNNFLNESSNITYQKWSDPLDNELDNILENKEEIQSNITLEDILFSKKPLPCLSNEENNDTNLNNNLEEDYQDLNNKKSKSKKLSDKSTVNKKYVYTFGDECLNKLKIISKNSSSNQNNIKILSELPNNTNKKGKRKEKYDQEILVVHPKNKEKLVNARDLINNIHEIYKTNSTQKNMLPCEFILYMLKLIDVEPKFKIKYNKAIDSIHTLINRENIIKNSSDTLDNKEQIILGNKIYSQYCKCDIENLLEKYIKNEKHDLLEEKIILEEYINNNKLFLDKHPEENYKNNIIVLKFICWIKKDESLLFSVNQCELEIYMYLDCIQKWNMIVDKL